jgi:hypothetical protein
LKWLVISAIFKPSPFNAQDTFISKIHEWTIHRDVFNDSN